MLPPGAPPNPNPLGRRRRNPSAAAFAADAGNNVHGKYRGEPRLRWDVLQDIAVRTRIPLVLHGASGIPAAELVKAAAMNVGKVNFSTELRTGVLAMLADRTGAHRADGENLQGLLAEWDAAAGTFAAGALATLARQPGGRLRGEG